MTCSVSHSSTRYCMRVKLEEVPDGDWICEECQKSERPVNLESSHAWKSQTEDISSISDLPANRHGVPSEAQSVKKSRVIGISAEPLRSSNERWQAESPNGISLASDERSQFEAAIQSENRLPDYIWLYNSFSLFPALVYCFKCLPF